MRHRVDISPQAKAMLKEIANELNLPSLTSSAVTELCIQSAYERLKEGEGNVLSEYLNPIQSKLDEIYNLLQEVLPEV